MNQQDIEQVVKAVLLKMKDSSQPASTVHEMGVLPPWMTQWRQQNGPSRAEERGDAPACHSCHSRSGRKHARELAELAVSETGMGRVDDKFAKTWRRRAARRASSVYLRRC